MECLLITILLVLVCFNCKIVSNKLHKELLGCFRDVCTSTKSISQPNPSKTVKPNGMMDLAPVVKAFLVLFRQYYCKMLNVAIIELRKKSKNLSESIGFFVAVITKQLLRVFMCSDRKLVH